MKKSKQPAAPAAPEQHLVITQAQFELIAQAEQTLQEATQQHRLVLRTILAGAGVKDAQILRVDRKGKRKVLVYCDPPEDEVAVPAPADSEHKQA